MGIDFQPAVLLLSPALFAQSNRDAITGEIPDSAGALILGVRLAFTNTEIGFDTVATGTGNYTLVVEQLSHG